MERKTRGRKPNTTMLIVDSKSIKNTDTAESKGYDGGKKVSGIKLHLATDIIGLPHAVYTTTANVTDRDGALEMLSIYTSKFSSVIKLMLDGGYSGDNFAVSVKSLIGAEAEVVKRNELHKFAVVPKRWIVERSFGWLEDFRRLWKNCERKLHTAFQMTVLAFITLILKRY
jgi:transposase